MCRSAATRDAYGAVLTADHLFSHPALHAGHKGLMVDRLDAPITDSSAADETPRLVPLARVICQNRNRTYAPSLGRFLQADPNATGAVLMQASAHHGRGMGALAAAFSMEDRYGDGLNVYEYLGSNPWGRSDVMGLWPSPADIAASAIMVGFRTLRGGLERLTEEYAGNMEHDIDWAMDWDMPDDWHTRGGNDWVGDAFRQGLWDGFREGLLEELDPAGIRDVVASGRGAFANYVPNSHVVKTVRRAGRMLLSGPLHHVVPKFLARFFNSAKEIVARLPLPLHQKFHKGLDNVLQADGFPAMNQREKWRVLLQNQPQLIPRLRMRLRQYTAQFELENHITGLLDLVDESLP